MISPSPCKKQKKDNYGDTSTRTAARAPVANEAVFEDSQRHEPENTGIGVTKTEESYPSKPVASSKRSAAIQKSKSTNSDQVPRKPKQAWKSLEEPSTGRIMYYHRTTRETTWEKPEALKRYEVAYQNWLNATTANTSNTNGDTNDANNPAYLREQAHIDETERQLRDSLEQAKNHEEELLQQLQEMQDRLEQAQNHEEELLQQLREMQQQQEKHLNNDTVASDAIATVTSKARYLANYVANYSSLDYDSDDSTFDEIIDLSHREFLLESQTLSTSLKYLNLSFSNLAVIPPLIGNLKRLKQLDLHCTELLLELPSEIGELTNLISLHLDSSNITMIPPSIGNLKYLEVLNLNDTNLSELPQEIWELPSLKQLLLSGTHLTVIPPSIGNLKTLEVLQSSEMELSELPQEIWELPSLKELELYSTHLTVIPPSIGNLKTLKILDLSKITDLYELPQEIGELTRLKRLHLSYWTEIPPSIGNLKTLEVMHLSGTEQKEEELPQGICLLPESLKYLYLLDIEISSRGLFHIERLKALSYLNILTSSFSNPQDESPLEDLLRLVASCKLLCTIEISTDVLGDLERRKLECALACNTLACKEFWIKPYTVRKQEWPLVLKNAKRAFASTADNPKHYCEVFPYGYDPTPFGIQEPDAIYILLVEFAGSFASMLHNHSS